VSGQINIEIPAVNGQEVEATVLTIFAADGTVVAEGDDIVELEVDKVTVVLSAPISGKLSLEVVEGDVCATGTPIGFVCNG